MKDFLIFVKVPLFDTTNFSIINQSELNQWKRSLSQFNEGKVSGSKLEIEDLILHCLFNNAPQLACTNNGIPISLAVIFSVAFNSCVQNLADRDNKTPLKILLQLISFFVSCQQQSIIN